MRGRIPKPAAAVAGCIAVICVAAACAVPANTMGRSTRTNTASEQATVDPSDRAASPEAAALGFQRSAIAARVRYSCFSGTVTYAMGVNPHGGRPETSAVRTGDRWIVSIREDAYSSWVDRFEVSRRHGGYCVSDILRQAEVSPRRAPAPTPSAFRPGRYPSNVPPR